MKKIFLKILTTILITLCIISTMSMYIPVKANSDVSLMTYEDYNFSFKGSCTMARNCTGMFLDVRVKATASNNNNETIKLDVYINNRGVTKSYTFLSDGQYHEFKNIFLGFSGGSSVAFTFTGANPEITIYTYMDVTS